MIKRNVILFLLLSATASLSIAATINFDFDSSLVSLRPGQMTTLSGTIQNIGTTTAFLNGDTFTGVSPLVIDDTPFLLNTPPSLVPAAQFAGPILTVSIPGNTGFGLYSGSFRILGGDTPSATTLL